MIFKQGGKKDRGFAFFIQLLLLLLFFFPKMKVLKENKMGIRMIPISNLEIELWKIEWKEVMKSKNNYKKKGGKNSKLIFFFFIKYFFFSLVELKLKKIWGHFEGKLGFVCFKVCKNNQKFFLGREDSLDRHSKCCLWWIWPSVQTIRIWVTFQIWGVLFVETKILVSIWEERWL